jgi:Transposase and inactivated derivatives
MMNNNLYIGIDIAKKRHVAGFVSANLLARKRFENCPSYAFDNDRLGFQSLLQWMQTYAPLAQCFVLLERTGHYHHTLLSYLQENNIKTFLVHSMKRMNKDKTDKRDALALANELYIQSELSELHVQNHDSRLDIHQAHNHLDDGLLSLVQRRADLAKEATRYKNSLIAISDELFPEFTQIFRDPVGPVALNVREAYLTPAEMVGAPLDALKACRGKGHRPSEADFVLLRDLAKTTIGIKNQGRIESLCLKQRQLITELRLTQSYIDEIESVIIKLVAERRDGQILMSMPCVGFIDAATILAHIGDIDNFSSAAKLRGYFGWAPQRTQTGSSKDLIVLDKAGNRLMKKTMYLIAWRAIKEDTEWRQLYLRLVRMKCVYDPRKQVYKGKNKVMGRVIGQMIGMIYAFLKRDRRLLATANGEVPPPMLYRRDVHHQHIVGSKAVRIISDSVAEKYIV